MPVIPDAEDDIYPIPIQVSADGSLLKTISPYLASGLKLISKGNSIANMFTYLGYPMPSISLDTSMQSYIQEIADGTSVAKLSNLSSNSVTTLSSLDSSGNNSSDGGYAQSTSGAALRELKNFFTIKDPESKFCQLSRFVDKSTGHCIWTTEENIKKMESETDDDNGDIQTDARTLIMESSTVGPGYDANMPGQSNETLQDSALEIFDADAALTDNGEDVKCCFLFCSSCNQM